MADKILVAEKDSTTSALVETRLRARGYDVFLATYSDEAIQLMNKVRFDLILIGSTMEGIDGMELSQKIKYHLTGLSVPVILMAEEHEFRKLVLSRDQGFDDFLIKPFDALSLQLRIALNLTRSRERLQANPLTSLPGSISIEQEIQKRLDRREAFSVCYVDINHFKSFNDRYGFEHGDRVIRHLAQIIARSLEKTQAKTAGFVGHIGGDDFIVLIDPESEGEFAQECIREFDRIIPTYYDETDRRQKSVTVKNRSGVPVSFPLMSISIAAVTSQHRSYQNMGEIARDAAEVKAYLKSQQGSHYLRDRRTEPIQSLEESLEIFPRNTEQSKISKPLGQMLLEVGLITEEELNQAVRRHIETGERIGQVLIRMNVVTSEDVGRFLEEKLSVPYVNLKNHSLSGDLARILTEEFIRTHRVVPYAITDEVLELAMVDPVNRDTIETVEEMSSLRVVPKFILENEFDEFLERNHLRLT